MEDEDLYSLDHSLAKLITPRLKDFKNKKGGFPCSLKNEEEWDNILDKMIIAFDIVSSERYWLMSNEECEKVTEGLDLFRDYFQDLWF